MYATLNVPAAKDLTQASQTGPDQSHVNPTPDSNPTLTSANCPLYCRSGSVLTDHHTCRCWCTDTGSASGCGRLQEHLVVGQQIRIPLRFLIDIVYLYHMDDHVHHGVHNRIVEYSVSLFLFCPLSPFYKLKLGMANALLFSLSETIKKIPTELVLCSL